MVNWFILMKCLVHANTSHDHIILFSIHVNSGYGIYNQLRLEILAHVNISIVYMDTWNKGPFRLKMPHENK